MARALTIAVVGMGVAILAGIAFLAATIVGRMSHHPPSAAAPHPASAATSAAASGQPFVAPPIDLPKGAQVEALGTGHDRAVLSLRLADGNRELLVIDLATGKLLGSVPLHAAP